MMPKRILIAEDNLNDVELTLAALAKDHLANEVVVVRDGVEALDYLYRRGEFAARPPGNPILFLLDLKMPKLDGLEVLRQVRSDPALRAIPTIILTSSGEERDIAAGYRGGANAYVVKPVEFDKLVQTVRRLNLFWLVVNQPPPNGSST